MLRWSFMLFVLSLVEGFLSRSPGGEGSALVAKISLIGAICLFIAFQRANERGAGEER
jgi:uncharacterized membrane protein YtjA (UPF0391 family)